MKTTFTLRATQSSPYRLKLYRFHFPNLSLIPITATCNDYHSRSMQRTTATTAQEPQVPCIRLLGDSNNRSKDTFYLPPYDTYTFHLHSNNLRASIFTYGDPPPFAGRRPHHCSLSNPFPFLHNFLTFFFFLFARRSGERTLPLHHQQPQLQITNYGNIYLLSENLCLNKSTPGKKSTGFF